MWPIGKWLDFGVTSGMTVTRPVHRDNAAKHSRMTRQSRELAINTAFPAVSAYGENASELITTPVITEM
jgi:hypothetical protein